MARPKYNMTGLNHPFKSWLIKLKVNMHILINIPDFTSGGTGCVTKLIMFLHFKIKWDSLKHKTQIFI